MFFKAISQTILISVFAFAIFVSFPKVFASSILLQSSQSSLGENDEYTINASLSINSSNGTTYYLRGAFYPSGTTHYCGYTWNGSSYYNGPYGNSGWLQLLPITVTNSSWSGTLKAKLDSTDSSCLNSGTYNFKIERFTAGGSGSFDSQNEQSISVVLPTATPSPMPTSQYSTYTPTSIPTTRPTLSPTIKPSPTHSTISGSSTSTITLASNSSSASISAISTGPEDVLGSSTSADKGIVAGIQEKKKNSLNSVALSLIFGGILILSSCGILFFYKWKKGRVLNESDNK